MAGLVVARFLVDRPVRPGMVRAILDTLTAQGGAYEPKLVRRSREAGMQRIMWSRPAGLLDDVGQAGAQTTFLRVAEGQPEPVLSFAVSTTPRTHPSRVTLSIPADALGGSKELEQILGVCKGLYLFLESPWGTVGITEGANRDEPVHLRWGNFFGPTVVAHVGPVRLLTSMAFIVEILPDGGIMLVTHASPDHAVTPQGRTMRRHLVEATGIGESLTAIIGRSVREDAPASDFVRVRRREASRPL